MAGKAKTPRTVETPGARRVSLEPIPQPGGDPWQGSVSVVDCYPPGGTEADVMTVSEKAYRHIYGPAGYSLEPGGDAPPTMAPEAQSNALAEAARVVAEQDAELDALRAEIAARDAADAAKTASTTESDRAAERARKAAEKEAKDAAPAATTEGATT